MKKVVVAMMCLVSLSAMASDRLEDEIVCRKVRNSGETDNGITLILKSNATVWQKLVVVKEHGFAGTREIVRASVPLNPIVQNRASGYIPEVNLIYQASGIRLSIGAYRLSGFPLTGDGHAALKLPGYAQSQMELECEAVK